MYPWISTTGPYPADGDWTSPCNRGFSQCGIPPCWIPPSFGFEKVFVLAGLRPCTAARPPMGKGYGRPRLRRPQAKKQGISHPKTHTKFGDRKRACCRKQFLRHAPFANKSREERRHSIKKQPAKAKKGIRS